MCLVCLGLTSLFELALDTTCVLVFDIVDFLDYFVLLGLTLIVVLFGLVLSRVSCPGRCLLLCAICV